MAMTESGLRRKADRYGLKLIKSRARRADTPGHGLYALLNVKTGGLFHEGDPAARTIHVLDLDGVEKALGFLG